MHAALCMFVLFGALVQTTELTLIESTSTHLPVRDGPVRFYDRQGAIGPQTHDTPIMAGHPIHPCEPYTHSLSAHSPGAHLLLSREPPLSGPLLPQAVPVLPEAPRPTCVVEEDTVDMLSSSSTCSKMQEELFGISQLTIDSHVRVAPHCSPMSCSPSPAYSSGSCRSGQVYALIN